MNKQSNNKQRYAIGFSVVASLIIVAFLAFINYSTSSDFPWIIYPAFAILWWPLTLIFWGKSSMKIFSLIGSLAIIALLVITNYLTSWSYPWFLYPSFAVIWWPIATFFGKKHKKLISVLAGVTIIAFAIVTNYLASPTYLWFYYPVFIVFWWLLHAFRVRPQTLKAYALVGAFCILALLAIDNVIHSPSCPWMLFTVYPVLLWPVTVFLGKYIFRLAEVLGLCAIGIVYYSLLNITVFPGFPWVIFPTFLLLWWPLYVAFARRGRIMAFAVGGTLLSAALFITLNVITTPQTIWAVYPLFALAWWPLTTRYYGQKRHC